MKPLHSILKWLSRCPCCAGRYHKRRGSKHGKTAARQKIKALIKEQLED